jgi:hypothetical protein
MKRFVFAGALMALAGLTLAQGTFTIRRPADGSTVRETVSIRLPKNSIPDGGYIGVYVNGKFLEAALPAVDASGEFIYKLDTKARKLPDGEHTIKVVLFVDYEDKPRIVNQSEVKVTIDNSTSIPVPQGGRLLRYSFPVGREWIYNLNINAKISMVSQALAQVGGRAAERQLEMESTRIMYAVDNSYGGEGLIRMQGLPDKGKDYTVVTVSGGGEATPRFSYEMKPIFMRITNTGREVFSASPDYFPLEGTSGDSARTDLVYIFPLPVLPSRAVKPGDVWNAPFLLGTFDFDQKDEKDKFTTALDSRGSFEGVEWYRGRRTAKLRMMVAAGPEQLGNVRNLNSVEGQAAKVEIEQVLWFDLDRGMVVRLDRNISQESIIETALPSAGGGAGGFGDSGAGAPGTGGPRAGGMGAAGGGGASAGAGWISPADWLQRLRVQFRPTLGADGGLTLFQVGADDGDGDSRGGGGRRGGGPPGGFGPGGPSFGPPRGGPGGGFRQPGAGAGAGTSKQVLRITSSFSIELE